MNLTKEESKEIVEKVASTLLFADDKLNFPHKLFLCQLNIVYIHSSGTLGSAQVAFDKSYKGGALLTLKINIDAYRQNKNNMLNDTIPHEVAHLVCSLNYYRMGRKIKPHGKEWKAVCMALGANPKSRAEHEDYDRSLLVSKRKVKKFLYVLDNGKEVELTSIRHNKVMSGTIYKVNLQGEPCILNSRHFKRALQ